MNICINLYPIRPNETGGVESFCRWVCQIPALHSTDHEFHLLLPRNSKPIAETLPQPPDWDPFDFIPTIESSSTEGGLLHGIYHNRLFPQAARSAWWSIRRMLTRIGSRLPRADTGLNNDINRSKWFNNGGFDVVHCPYQFTDPLPPLNADIPYVINLHDFQHEHFPQFFTNEDVAWRRRFYTESAKAAKCVVVSLEQVKQDVIRFCGVEAGKVCVIRPPRPFEGLPPISEEEKSGVKEKYKLPDTFAFYPAVMWEHKNHVRLLHAFNDLRHRDKSVHLVCSGTRGPVSAQVENLVTKPGLDKCVHILGYVEHAALRAIYALAAYCIFPTLYEGIGMPVYEALAMGCPVACSNIAGFPEVVGNAGLVFDPYNVEEIADAMYRLATEPELRQKFREEGPKRLEGYSWEKFAQEYLKAYEFAVTTPRQ